MKLNDLEKIKQLEEVLLDNSHESEAVWTVSGESLTKKEYVKRIAETEAAMDRGEYSAHEDLKREVRSWKK